MTECLLDQEAEKAEKADELSRAEDAILEAVQEYRRVLAEGPVLDSTEISYKPSTALIDDQRFKIEPTNTLYPYRYDGVLNEAAGTELPALQVLLLAESPHWEDRIRAKALYASMREDITLPDGFPCIYEPADSPNKGDHLYKVPSVWVASPDEAMLHALLPLYRELWDAHESQWPHAPNRTFEVGRLDKVSPHRVYRPGTTPDQVIAQTMLTHDDMYRTAPEHLKKMHPRYDDWNKSRTGSTTS
jgi:hypothetical protein